MKPKANLPFLSVYSPASQLNEPARLFANMCADVLASRELAWRLFVRNVSARYRRTLFGYVWAFLPPILTTLVFVFLNHAGYFTVGYTEVPYPVFLLAGLILWQLFCDAVNMPLQMVQQSHSLLTKVNFPREALVIAGAGEVLFVFLIRLVLLLLALLWFKVGISWAIFLAPCGIFVLLGLGIGLGLVLTPVGILYHDVAQGLPFVLYLWMFLTPVLYPVARQWRGSTALALNPVSPVLDTTRAWLLSSMAVDLSGFMIATAAAVGTLLFGWLLYRLALPILIERISA